MKKIYAIVVMAIIAIFSYCVLNNRTDCYHIFNSNVEALAKVENMIIECDNFSVTMICKKSCICGREWKTLIGYGHATGLKGRCECGRKW